MLAELARNWWVLLVRGLAAIIFGILAFVWPGITLLAFVILFGAYALADGAVAIAWSITGRGGERPWWGMLLVGLAGVAAGLVTLLWPGITAVSLLAVIAAWAIVRGVLEIIAAVRLRKVIHNEWLLALAGALSVLWGVLLIVQPAAGALAMVWLIGAFAIAFGIVAVSLAVRLRMIQDRVPAAAVRVAR